MEGELKRIYYGDSVGSLRGVNALYKQAKDEGVEGVTIEGVKRWLSSQPVYTLYRPARKNYRRRQIESFFPGDVVQIDIMVMDRFITWNTHKYVLLAYDTYSKYLMAVPIHDRKPATVQAAIELMFRESPFTWASIFWDKEGAFISRHVQAFLKSEGIHNYTTTAKVKAPGVEGMIRTIRTAVQRHFESTKSQHWEDYLPIFVRNYNNRVHSVTKLKPVELSVNPMLIPQKAKPRGRTSKKEATNPPIGTYVRLNRLRPLFDKEATGSYTVEVFRVRGHKKSRGIPMIFVEDLQGEPIRGALYPQEYQVIDWDGEKEIDQVIKTRKRRGHPKESFVSYRGYPKKFNAWIDSV